MAALTKVQRYVDALKAEADAVRKLSRAMEEQHVLNADIAKLEEHYKHTVGERRTALRELWGKKI